jgi:hypothetical protein
MKDMKCDWKQVLRKIIEIIARSAARIQWSMMGMVGVFTSVVLVLVLKTSNMSTTWKLIPGCALSDISTCDALLTVLSTFNSWLSSPTLILISARNRELPEKL